MPIKDVLLPLVGEPSDATVAAIDKCVAVAGDLGACITALAIEEDILVRPQVIVSADLDNSTATEAVRSVTDAKSLLKAFDSAATRFGVRNEQKLQRLAAAEIPLYFAKCARLKDLSLVPVKSHVGQSEKVVERLLFGSGRPVLMCPEHRAAELRVAFDHILVAWDHSAPAARAVADALPLLPAATSVRIITATDENTPEQRQSGRDLVSHLGQHGVKATFETVKIDGSSVGMVFEAYLKAHAIDLLVMGAYRHSRLNEVVWGGATKTVIGRPPSWVMMSR
ncbi:MAG: universal stress protein [Bradyrhizobium sp.]|uniref:universal stress protein n=1 Tax=Bradyrhizobium sp. TaxID=376 RepID=UPI001DE5270A|nr:universal stress protein [Bradyrhizobium sp.]MBV9560589.1 universal stress protein [Bradyrhizobium sp.]